MPGIAGIAARRAGRLSRSTPPSIARHPHYDAGSKPDNPRWYMVDVQLQRRLKRIITLDELRAHAARALEGMPLLRTGNRLSVMPVDAAHWRFILSLE